MDCSVIIQDIPSLLSVLRLSIGSVSVYVYIILCMCVVLPFILNVMFMDVRAGVAQEEGQTGFLHLPSAVLALIFIARRIHPFISVVDREVEF